MIAERTAMDGGDIRRSAGRSVTATNSDLRYARRTAYRAAQEEAQYWKARRAFHFEVENAQYFHRPEGRLHPIVTRDEDGALLKSYRAALVKQLLTPAPDLASVKWKQTIVASSQLQYCGVNPERVKRTFAEDLAFLAAHPTRRSNRGESQG
jgi:hypothetical protein